MVALLYWKELLIALLIIGCLWLINKNQDLRHELKETVFIHEKLVLEAEARNAKAVADAQEQRQLDAEKYASEISKLNDRYAAALSNSNGLQLEIKTYSDRLHTVTREAVENYAKAGASLYNECRKEYLDLGYYAAKLDAELDSKTKAP